MSYYLHKTPGRLRIKTPTVKGKPKKAVELKERIDGIRGISSTAVNPVTGSVVVHYDSAVIAQTTVLEILANGGHFDVNRAVSSDKYINDAASRVGKILGKAVFGAIVDRTFSGSALSLLGVLKPRKGIAHR